MKFQVRHVLLALFVATSVVIADQAPTAEALLESARKKEVVDGDLTGAIRDYPTIASRFKDNAAVASRALVRMAECYEKQGSTEAKKLFERVIREYPEQKDTVAIAQARLASGVAAVPNNRMTHRVVWTVKRGKLGGDVYGKVSPDGRYIPYIDWDLKGDLFVHDLVTDTNRRLTNAARDEKGAEEWAYQSVFSRDGRHVAYTWFKGQHSTLRVVRVDRRGVPEARVLFDNSDVRMIWPEDWSPDGKWIAVGLERSDRTAQIGLLGVEDGSLRILKSMEWRTHIPMSISPDGKYLAYSTRGNETAASDIYVLSSDGSRELPAVVHHADDILVGWTPDGSQILFSSDRTGSVGVWAVPFDGSGASATPQLLKGENRSLLAKRPGTGFTVHDVTPGDFGDQGGIVRFREWDVHRASARTRSRRRGVDIFPKLVSRRKIPGVSVAEPPPLGGCRYKDPLR
jgi:hypothetical protein